jgi:hypothetical protein
VTTFPTGKPHVSFSEVKTWKECGWRHKLVHIDKISVFKPSHHLDFGKIVHAELEDYLEHKTFDLERMREALTKAWSENGFENLPSAIKDAEQILQDIPTFLDETFPEWSFMASEHELYEDIPENDIKFKGFVDGMIRAKNSRGKEILWIIDWKTTASPRGWSADKKSDFLIQMQVMLYKFFCAKKFEIDPKDIKCGFVLLKRGAKPGKTCELVEVSVGPKAFEKATKVLSSMISAVRINKPLKNRASCTYCEFKNTEHCSGSSEYAAFTTYK